MKELKMIPHNKPTLGNDELIATGRVLSSGWLAQGIEVASFENEFCEFLNIPKGNAIAVSSGTAAIYLALWGASAKNRKVGFPTYVCSAIRNAVAMAGAKEMIFDVDENTPNIDIDALNKLNPDIALIPHMFGLPVNIKKIRSQFIIEDCAQSLGAKINGISTGLIGDIGIFSFYATKMITSGGQGGMIVSKSKAIIDKIRDFREFDQRKDHKKRFNFQMTDLQAAIGRVQLQKLPKFLKAREEIFNQYKKRGLNLLDIKDNNFHPVRYRAVAIMPQPKKLIRHLESFGIKAIIPIADWELLCEKGKCPNANKLTRQTISLPIYPDLLTGNQFNIVIESLKKYFS
jgi:perosamine synthetase